MPSIRLADVSRDALAIQSIYAPYVMETAITFEYEVPSLETMRERLETTLQFFPWLVYERDGAVLAYAYASRHRDRAAYQWSVDVSVYVDQQHRGVGIGRDLYTKLFDLLQRQGFCNALAGITLPNDASIAIHAAFGFKMIGIYPSVGYKFGKWHDTAWMGMQLKTFSDPPQPLLSIKQLDSAI